MTEKKFKLIKSDPAEPYDSRMYIGIKYDSKELYGYSEICDLLNELYDENQVLQDKVDLHILLTDDERHKVSRHIKKLEKENQSLTDTVEALQSELDKRFILKSNSDYFTTDEVVDLLKEQKETILNLKIENQILQGENEDLNEDLLQLESFRNLLKSKGIDLDD